MPVKAAEKSTKSFCFIPSGPTFLFRIPAPLCLFPQHKSHVDIRLYGYFPSAMVSEISSGLLRQSRIKLEAGALQIIVSAA
jgi:hypothetical protein